MSEQIFEIEKLEATQLPELQGLKEKQLQIVKENPYVEIVDNATYETAKKSRTALVSARTDIEKQDKVIASKIKKFREMVAGVSAELIGITKPHEDKQQEEVKRYEAEKEKERLEKQRIEEERKSNIKNSIDVIYNAEMKKIETLTFEMIDTLKVDWEQHLFKTDATQFEEFELDFNEKLALLKNQLLAKENSLREKEAQRLENERLKAEREKLDADRKAEEERMKADREKFEAEQREAQAKIDAENQRIADEKARLQKIEDDRIAKEEADRKAKEDEEKRIQDQKDADEKAKAEAERLEALKPDKEKAIKYLSSFKFSEEYPQFKDLELEQKFDSILRLLDFDIEEAIKEINNF